MIKIENVEVNGWLPAIRGMRNQKNSWSKSDSGFFPVQDKNTGDTWIEYVVGENDLNLMKNLVKAGNDHSKFMRMITVYIDVTAPLFWWKEADTYKVGTVANSCSTMHKIHSKPIELSDFSVDNLDLNIDESFEMNGETSEEFTVEDLADWLIEDLEKLRKTYLETNDKRYWRALIQFLPSSYNQKRTMCLNYAVLRNMYHSRKNHKLDEWREFCKWIETLPYAELITM